jgi:hypothetical protein
VAKLLLGEMTAFAGDGGHDPAIGEVVEAEGDPEALDGIHGPVDGSLVGSHGRPHQCTRLPCENHSRSGFVTPLALGLVLTAGRCGGYCGQ